MPTHDLARSSGFTLIELSIVLVIIGLIVGGVLVGQDLISAAATRATVSQIEKYNTAMNAFRTKYGYLPGDIRDPDATRFGFQTRGSYAGEGDGNGVVEGVYNDLAGQNSGEISPTGESAAFWVDLSAARMIDGSFSRASPNVVPAADVTGTNIDAYFPRAKLGRGNFVTVWATPDNCLCTAHGSNGMNWFGISTITRLYQFGGVDSATAMTVSEAYNADKKVDDGLPQSGRVQAFFDGATYPVWAGDPTNDFGYPFTTATGATATSCFDNGSVSGATMKYSLSQNGNKPNCAVSFRFQ